MTSRRFFGAMRVPSAARVASALRTLAIVSLALLAPFAVAPLAYARIDRFDHAMGASARRRLLALVDGRPGLRIADAARALGLSRSAVEHHARILQRVALVARETGRGRRLFLAGARPRTRVERALVAGGARSRVLDAVRAAPAGITRAELAEALAGVPIRTRNHALRALLAEGLVRETWDAGRDGCVLLLDAPVG